MTAILVNPRGARVCTCLAPNAHNFGFDPGVYRCPEEPGWYFICDQPMDSEDGLCEGCRTSELCRGWRKTRAVSQAFPNPWS